jgi:hypothetical protein
MTDLPKRELGRTGLRVTMLGYGAMELRGAPRPMSRPKPSSTPYSTPASTTLIPRSITA